MIKMNISGRCAACKYLRRRCPSDCIFSPYFPSNDPQRFAFVHRIYGASNVAKMLQQLPPHLRAEAAETLCYEAQCRIQDPIYGCVRVISQLHQQIRDAECQLAKTRAEIAFINPNRQEPPPQAHVDDQQIIEVIEPNFNFLQEQSNANAAQTQYGSSSKVP